MEIDRADSFNPPAGEWLKQCHHLTSETGQQWRGQRVRRIQGRCQAWSKLLTSVNFDLPRTPVDDPVFEHATTRVELELYLTGPVARRLSRMTGFRLPRVSLSINGSARVAYREVVYKFRPHRHFSTFGRFQDYDRTHYFRGTNGR